MATGSPTLFDTAGSTVTPVGSPTFFDTRGIQSFDPIGSPTFYDTRGVVVNPIGSPTFYDTRGIAIDPVGSPTFYDIKGARLGTGALVRVKQLDIDLPLPTFISTIAGLPAANGRLGYYAFVTDDVAGPVLVFSDGADWRRWTDRNVATV